MTQGLVGERRRPTTLQAVSTAKDGRRRERGEAEERQRRDREETEKKHRRDRRETERDRDETEKGPRGDRETERLCVAASWGLAKALPLQVGVLERGWPSKKTSL